MKNIWIFNHYAYPPAYATNIRHFKFAQNLEQRGYNVTIFSASSIHRSRKNLINDGSKYKESTYDNVRFVFIKTLSYFGNGLKRIMNMFEYPFKLLFITKEFKDSKPDVIYSSSPNPLTWFAAYLVAKKYNAKFIAETRDLWPETLVKIGKLKERSIITKMLYKYEKYILEKADQLIYTIPGGNNYAKKIGIDVDKTNYINNGIDLEEFEYNKKKYILEDKDLNSKEKFKVIFTGSLGYANGVDRIVDLAKLVQDRNILDIIFIIYGDGPEKDNLVNKAKKYNLKNLFFKGRVEKKYIPYILSKSNLNLFTLIHAPGLFKYGLSPNKMFDYFASGKPIISNVDCGFDMLEKYSCGKTVSDNSNESLLKELLNFYHMSDDEYNCYCENSLHAAQNFDFKVLTDKLEAVINK